jgi:hypothetical protein
MKTKSLEDWIFIISALFFIWVAPAWTQTTSQDSIRAEDQTSIQVQQYEETVLEPIRIEAVIEMPRVALIPKRIETEMGGLDFGQRSFDKELRAKPKVLSSILEELESAKKIRRLKKTLAKKSK